METRKGRATDQNASTSRSALVVAGAIVLAAIIVAGAVLLSRNDEPGSSTTSAGNKQYGLVGTLARDYHLVPGVDYGLCEGCQGYGLCADIGDVPVLVKDAMGGVMTRGRTTTSYFPPTGTCAVDFAIQITQRPPYMCSRSDREPRTPLPSKS